TPGRSLTGLSPATPPSSPTSPSTPLNVAIGVAVGALLGGLTALARGDQRSDDQKSDDQKAGGDDRPRGGGLTGPDGRDLTAIVDPMSNGHGATNGLLNVPGRFGR